MGVVIAAALSLAAKLIGGGLEYINATEERRKQLRAEADGHFRDFVAVFDSLDAQTAAVDREVDGEIDKLPKG